MRPFLRILIALVCLPACLGLRAVIAQEEPKAAPPLDHWDSRLTRSIDDAIAARLQDMRITPAPAADDATFHRRVMLDLAGRIPTIDETERFLADQSPDKRHRLVDGLLSGPEMPLHWREVLNDWIMGRAMPGHDAFVAWLGRSLAANRSWGAIAADVLVARPETAADQPAITFLQSYLVKDGLKPEFGADLGRAFFGVDLQCARCHDHPYVDGWLQAHYFGLTAFFSRSHVVATKTKVVIGEKPTGDLGYTSREGVKFTAELLFLDGTVVAEPVAAELAPNDDRVPSDPATIPVPRRDAFAKLALSPESSYFKRAAVNRVWKQLMDRGFVEPVDMIHAGNPASHPELFDRLADDFASHGYDLRRLIAAIVHSEAYGRSSRWNGSGELPPASSYAVAPLKRLDPEQLAFSIVLATGHDVALRKASQLDATATVAELREKATARNGLVRTLGRRFVDSVGDTTTTTSQALFLSNDDVPLSLLTPQDGHLVAALAGLADDASLIRRAWLTVLSRPATGNESALVAKYLAERGTPRVEACGEIVWSLINGAEFRFNH